MCTYASMGSRNRTKNRDSRRVDKGAVARDNERPPLRSRFHHVIMPPETIGGGERDINPSAIWRSEWARRVRACVCVYVLVMC